MDESVATVRLQGVLEKRGKFTGVLLTRKYLCTLENGQLKYRREGEKEKGLDIPNVQYIRPGKDCSFEIVTRTTTHIFVAGTVSERDDWVKALRESMGSTFLRLPSCHSVKLPSPRSYSDDGAALYETIADSPKMGTKFPRSLTLNAMSRNKSQKWLSVNPYETVTDPPGVAPLITFLDSPPKISKDGDESESTPPTSLGLYESVGEDRNDLVVYEGDAEEEDSSCRSDDLPDSDDSPVESDLYAYACADDVRKCVLKDKPKLCGEYSTVHDRRGSELLYSEVGVWDGVQEQTSSDSGKVVCGLATVMEATSGAMPDGGIYQLANDPDASLPVGKNSHLGMKASRKEPTSRLGGTPKLPSSTDAPSKSLDISECYTEEESDYDTVELSHGPNRTIGLEGPRSPKDYSTVYDNFVRPQCFQLPQRPLPSPPLSALQSSVFNAYSSVSSASASLSSFPQPGGIATFPETGASDVCDKMVELDTDSLTLSNSAEGSSGSGGIPKLPYPRISSKHQSPFDEIRTVMGETWEHREVDQLQRAGAPAKVANAVDELRQFLQKLDK